MIWVSSSVMRPTTRSRVDWGLGLVMASRWPTRRLRSVDLPAFGRPATVTVPALVICIGRFRAQRGNGGEIADGRWQTAVGTGDGGRQNWRPPAVLCRP